MLTDYSFLSLAGRGGEECAKADGRELWLLGEMYDVAGLREWLLSEGIDSSNVGAAYEFGLVAEGVEREGIGARCVEVVADAQVGSVVVEEAGLRGVGREAAKGLAVARASGGEGRRLGWRHVRGAYRMLEGWMRANGGAYGGGDVVSWFRGCVAELGLGVMPLKALREVVEGSEYLDGDWVSGVIERKEAAGDQAYEVEYREGRRYDLGSREGVTRIAWDGEGPGQRMAVVDFRKHVVILDAESGVVVATAGSEGDGPGQFRKPARVAFSGTGEMYVSDCELHRISVFDREGRYVRGIGGLGRGQGQFYRPQGLCFTADGDLVVADSWNHRVQVLREDGTFVRSIGSRGSEEGQFNAPHDVCGMPNGSIAVLDFGNRRVQVFDGEGGFLRSIGSEGDGQFLGPRCLVTGGEGEIIVTDTVRKDVQVFSGEGELLQIIGPEGDSKVSWRGRPWDVAACGDGRLFVTDGTSVVLLS